WQVEETGIKIHIAPFAELITHSLTTGYLIPYLKSAGAPLVGPNGGGSSFGTTQVKLLSDLTGRQTHWKRTGSVKSQAPYCVASLDLTKLATSQHKPSFVSG